MAPAQTASLHAPTPLCLDAHPEEDLVVLATRGANVGDSSRGAPEWLRRALAFNEFVCLSRTPDHFLSVVVGESFLKKVELPKEVEVERQWAALRLDKASLEQKTALGSFASLCTTLREAGLEPCAVSTPDCDQLLLRKRQLPVAVSALLGAGHAIWPARRLCMPSPSGLISKNDRCKAFAGAWGLLRRERPTGMLLEQGTGRGDGPVRLQATCGLYVDIRISTDGKDITGQASCAGCLEAANGQAASAKHCIVDFQPSSSL
jgi:hypothetical protein